VAEQALYRREGLPWLGLNLPDSTPVVTAIACTFKTLDEYSQQLAKGFEKTSDENFCQKTVDEAQKDSLRKEVLKPLKMSNKRGSTAGLAMNEGFIIKHYAGPVEYNTKGWLDKNNDRLLVECEELICSSEFNFVKTLGDDDKGKVPFRSISKKYSADLENLLKTLNQCQLHYIRCFKPNALQQRGNFDDSLVLDQIVQCGTIELVKIMHDGYPNRCVFDELVGRFRDLLPPSFQRYGLRTFIEALMLAYDVPKEDWALGMSRLFLKAGQLKALEDLRSKGAEPDPEKLQQIVRGIIRKRWLRAIHAVQLCNYLPRFLSEIRAAQAVRALATRALLLGRLAKVHASARKRIELRRRFQVLVRVAVLTKQFVANLSAKVRRQRSWKQLKTAVGTYILLKSRALPWLDRSRQTVKRRHEDARKEAERKAAEERKRLEEERRAAEAERRAAEEELKRKAEEERQRLEAERQKQEEELRLRAEEEREQVRQQMEAEKQKYEEEKRRMEEELQKQKAELEQKQREMMEEAERKQEEEKQKWEKEVERMKAEQEYWKMETIRELRAELREVPSNIMEVASPCRISPSRRAHAKGNPEDDVCSTHYPADDPEISCSTGSNYSADGRQHMEERIKALEEDAAERQRELMKLVRALSSKQRGLDWDIQNESELSLPPSDEYPLMPLAPCTPRRLSRASSTAGSTQGEGRTRRHSVAVNDKRNWVEQRNFLMEELYPDGCPLRSTPSKGRRASIGGSAAESLQGERHKRQTQGDGWSSVKTHLKSHLKSSLGK